MKKFMKSLMLVAVAAMGFVSCSNELDDVNNQGDKTYSLIFSAEKPSLESESRTEFVDGSVIWSSDDKIRVAYKQNDGAWSKYYASNQAVSEDDFKTATFELNNSFTADANQPTTNAYTFYAGYPYNAIGGGNTNAPSNDALSVKVATEQTMKKAGTFDATADIMVGVSSEYNAWPTEPVGLTFARLVAHGCVTLKNLAAEEGETVKSVTFTAPEGVNLTGSGSVNFVEQTMTALNNNTVTVNLPADTSATSDVVVWFCSAPATIASGANLTVEVETSRGTYTRTITANANGIKFLQNRYNTLGINMATATFEAAAVVEGLAEGDYFIVAQRSSGNFFYMTPDLGTASTKRFQAVDTGVAEVGSVATTNNEYKWTIAKSGAAYTMQAPAGTFVTYSSGNSANLDATGKTLNIVKVENQDYYNISLVDTPARVLALNNTSGNNYFAFYSGSQVVNLYLILAAPADPNAPTLSLDKSELLFEVAGGSQTVTATTTNYNGAITASSDNSHFSVSVVGNVVTVTAPENEENTEQTATITINAGDLSQTVSVSQKADVAAMPGTGDGTEASPYDVTRAYAVIDAAGGSVVEGVYVKGIVTEDAISFNSSYKSLTYYISNDGTATNKFQVYSGKNLDNTDFASTGDLHAGDEVVVCGNIKKYNTTYEFDYNNYIVSLNCPHAAGSVEQTVTFTSKPESVTVGKTVAVAATANTTVTYSSSNATIASVDAETGVVTGVNVGTVTITATAAAEGIYKQATASYQLTVNAAQSGVETPVYVKVTSAPADWSGTYLMVYENSSSVGYVFKSDNVTGQYNYTTGTVISGGEIEATDELANYAVTVAAYSTGYSIKSVGSSKYLQGKGSGSNGTNAYDTPSLATTFTFNSDGTVSIINNTNHFVFNTSGYMRFYKATTAAGSQYKKLCLYKLAQ